MAVSMLMLSLYSSYGDLLPSKDLVTIFFLLIFIITSTFGFLTIPFTMLPELFPIHVRGITAGFSVSFAYLSSFVAIKLYPTMVESMGSGSVFLIYGVISIAATFFAYYILPETKGKSLEEIENMFKSRSDKYNESETRI
jgi:MFS family permease